MKRKGDKIGLFIKTVFFQYACVLPFRQLHGFNQDLKIYTFFLLKIYFKKTHHNMRKKIEAPNELNYSSKNQKKHTDAKNDTIIET